MMGGGPGVGSVARWPSSKQGNKGKGPKKAKTERYASSSAAAAAATADGFGHARASKFECGSGTLA